jgi:hypothetical protein
VDESLVSRCTLSFMENEQRTAKQRTFIVEVEVEPPVLQQRCVTHQRSFRAISKAKEQAARALADRHRHQNKSAGPGGGDEWYGLTALRTLKQSFSNRPRASRGTTLSPSNESIM